MMNPAPEHDRQCTTRGRSISAGKVMAFPPVVGIATEYVPDCIHVT